MARRANALTDTALRAAKWGGADQWISDGGSRGAGRLVAKVSQAGIAFYFAYFNAAAQRRFLPVGKYDPKGERGMTLQQARDRAAALSVQYRAGDTELHERLEHEKSAEIMARRAAKEAAERDAQLAKVASLRRLLEGYHGHLQRSGKQSADDVLRIFERHVFEAWPTLAAKRATEVTIDELVTVLGKLTEAGKGRTAAKLRSYLRAAYALAIRSKTDPDAPLELRTFGIVANPVASIGALSKYNRARDRVLTVEEFAAYLRRVAALPDGPKKAALELAVLLGGQRPTQLLRARPADVDLTAGTITLFDGKGARRQARRHVLPLTRRAIVLLEPLLAVNGESPFVFSSDGTSALRTETISAERAEIAAAMLKAKEARESFELRDVRRTCETMLAAMGVSSDLRAQIQSHGLGGVQQRHYDRHDYMLEKRAVLEKWQRRLDELLAGKKAAVAKMPRRAAA